MKEGDTGAPVPAGLLEAAKTEELQCPEKSPEGLVSEAAALVEARAEMGGEAAPAETAEREAPSRKGSEAFCGFFAEVESLRKQAENACGKVQEALLAKLEAMKARAADAGSRKVMGAGQANRPEERESSGSPSSYSERSSQCTLKN